MLGPVSMTSAGCLKLNGSLLLLLTRPAASFFRIRRFEFGRVAPAIFKYQWKSFWFATQLCPQNDWQGLGSNFVGAVMYMCLHRVGRRQSHSCHSDYFFFAPTVKIYRCCYVSVFGFPVLVCNVSFIFFCQDYTH